MYNKHLRKLFLGGWSRGMGTGVKELRNERGESLVQTTDEGATLETQRYPEKSCFLYYSEKKFPRAR